MVPEDFEMLRNRAVERGGKMQLESVATWKTATLRKWTTPRTQPKGCGVRTGKWVFDLDRGTLLFTSSNLNLAFDSGARRATPIPPRIREKLEARYHPDLR